MIIVVKLLLAHMIGDFLLQPTTWVKSKEKNKLKAPQLYLHVLIHGFLVMVFVGKWWAAIFIIFTHLVIDAGKAYLQNEKNKKILFFVDQLLHLLVIVGVIQLFFDIPIDYSFSGATWIIVTALLFITIPASIIIKLLINQWAPQTEEKKGESLQNAGMYIGMLERFLVLIFIVSGNWAAVGFLLAAKSVFRFGDLRKSKDRKLTEYILIGTLLSFGMAIVTGMLVVHMISYIGI